MTYAQHLVVTSQHGAYEYLSLIHVCRHKAVKLNTANANIRTITVIVVG